MKKWRIYFNRRGAPWNTAAVLRFGDHHGIREHRLHRQRARLEEPHRMDQCRREIDNLEEPRRYQPTRKHQMKGDTCKHLRS